MVPTILKTLRISHSLRQSDVAEMLGTVPSYISELETGRKQPSPTLLLKYGDAFGVPTSNILLLAEWRQGIWTKEQILPALCPKMASIAALISETSHEQSEQKD